MTVRRKSKGSYQHRYVMASKIVVAARHSVQAGNAKGLVYACCLSCMSINRVRSFIIDICNGSSFDNVPHNLFLKNRCPKPSVQVQKIQRFGISNLASNNTIKTKK